MLASMCLASMPFLSVYFPYTHGHLSDGKDRYGVSLANSI